MQKQVDAKRMKLGQERHKVFQAAPQAIDVPSHHDVELALGRVPAQRVERRPSIATLRAANAVVLVDPPPPATQPALPPGAAHALGWTWFGLVSIPVDKSQRLSWLRPSRTGEKRTIIRTPFLR